jgi:hypothetical protein
MLAGGGEKTTDIADGGRETTDKRGLTRIRRIREKVTGINILIICAFFYFIKFRLRSSLFFSSALIRSSRELQAVELSLKQ